MFLIFLLISLIPNHNLVHSLQSDYDATSDFNSKKIIIDGFAPFYRIEQNDNNVIDVTRYFNQSKLSHAFECSFRFDAQKVNESIRKSFSLIKLQDEFNGFRLEVKICHDNRTIQWEIMRNERVTIHVFDLKNVNIFDGYWHNFKYFLFRPSYCGLRLKVFLNFKNLPRSSIYARGINLDLYNKLIFDELKLSIALDADNETVPIDIKSIKFSRNLNESSRKCCSYQQFLENSPNSLDGNSYKPKIYSKRSSELPESLMTDQIKVKESYETENSVDAVEIAVRENRPIPPIVFVVYFMFCFGLIFMLITKQSFE